MKKIILCITLLMSSYSAFALEYSEELLKKAIKRHHTEEYVYPSGDIGHSILTRTLDREDNPVREDDIVFLSFNTKANYWMTLNPVSALHDGISNLAVDQKQDHDSVEALMEISGKEYLYTCSLVSGSVRPLRGSFEKSYEAYFRGCDLQDLATGEVTEIIYKDRYTWTE